MPPKKPFASKFSITLPAGGATPAPPVGPVIGQHGINIQEFVRQFNDGTMDHKANGYKIPCICYVFEDKSFELEFKQPPASDLIKKKINLPKGSGRPNTEKVGKITWAQLKEVAEAKMPDLNANDVEAGAWIMFGTAQQMGLEVPDAPAKKERIA